MQIRIKKARLRKVAAAITMLALLQFSYSANAQAPSAYPNQPVRIVVPYAAGGMLDTLARHLGNAVTAELGQPIVIENRPGAAGRIGASAVAQSEPNGLTLLATTIGTMTILPLIPPKPPFDAERDFIPVATLSRQPLFLAVRTSSGLTDFAQFIAFAKANPGKLTYASPGAGSEPHLALERLLKIAGVDVLHIPHRGGGPAVIDFVGGRIDVVALPEITLQPALGDGKTKLLATFNPTRLQRFADIPTLSELGYPAATYTMTTALFAPTKTPPAVIQRWQKVLLTLEKDPGFVKAMRDAGSEISVGDGKELAKVMSADRDEWSKVIGSLGLRVD